MKTRLILFVGAIAVAGLVAGCDSNHETIAQFEQPPHHTESRFGRDQTFFIQRWGNPPSIVRDYGHWKTDEMEIEVHFTKGLSDSITYRLIKKGQWNADQITACLAANGVKWTENCEGMWTSMEGHQANYSATGETAWMTITSADRLKAVEAESKGVPKGGF